MRGTGFYLTILAVVFTGIAFYGCSNSPAPSNSTDAPAGNGQQHDDHDMHEGHDHETVDSGEDAMAKMKKGLANLSESDRSSAMKQHMCPVSGEMLGAMGEPIKVTVKDQEVWICCEGCKEDLLANPDKYLAKIKK